MSEFIFEELETTRELTIGGTEIKLNALTVQDIVDLGKVKEEDSIYIMIQKSLRDSMPELQKHEIAKLPLSVFNQIVEEIMDFNEIDMNEIRAQDVTKR